MVVDHILSNIERYKLRRYLEENITFNDFVPLMHIIKHGAKQIKEDHLLIEAALRKFNE